MLPKSKQFRVSNTFVCFVVHQLVLGCSMHYEFIIRTWSLGAQNAKDAKLQNAKDHMEPLISISAAMRHQYTCLHFTQLFSPRRCSKVKRKAPDYFRALRGIRGVVLRSQDHDVRCKQVFLECADNGVVDSVRRIRN